MPPKMQCICAPPFSLAVFGGGGGGGGRADSLRLDDDADDDSVEYARESSAWMAVVDYGRSNIY